jgi:hypothetical protein
MSSAAAQVAELQMMFVTRRWHQLNEGLWSSPAAVLATISGLITIISFLVTLVQWLAGVPVGHSA